jgi:hypothetical protein
VSTERIRDRFMPWSGLGLGTLGAGFAHQLGSDSTFQDCQFSAPAVVIVGTILGLLLVGAGALGSWRVHAAESETPARRMIAVVSLMASSLFAVAIILPFVAALVIPRCWA